MVSKEEAHDSRRAELLPQCRGAEVVGEAGRVCCVHTSEDEAAHSADDSTSVCLLHAVMLPDVLHTEHHDGLGGTIRVVI